MRAHAIGSLLLLFGTLTCSSAPPAATVPATAEQLPIRQLSVRGLGEISDTLEAVIESPGEWQAFWAKHPGRNNWAAPTVPQIDFSQNRLLLASLGFQGMAGDYYIGIDTVRLVANTVVATVVTGYGDPTNPAFECAFVSIVSYPVAIVVIPRRGRTVQFRRLPSQTFCY